MKLFTFLLLFCLYAAPLRAQPGALDPGFGMNGTTTTHAGGLEFPYAAAMQPDGKILVAGLTTGGFDFVLVRYRTDGQPDSSFGAFGIVKTGFGDASGTARAMLVQPDGKILLAGQTVAGLFHDLALARYLPDGSPDLNFGLNGVVVTDLGTGFEYINALALRPDGRILAAGAKEGDVYPDFLLLRYYPNGILDQSFGAGGYVTTDIQEEVEEAHAMTLQPDGKILLAGFASANDEGDFAMVRYLANGSLDTGFGSGGIVTTNLSGNDVGTTMQLLPDGKILLAGEANYDNVNGKADIGIARYHPDGGLDEGFGTGGRIVQSLGASNEVWGLTLQPDGKFYICGQTDAVDAQKQWLLARYLPDGGPDPAFGAGGIVVTDFPGSNEYAVSAMLQPDNKIVLAGRSGSITALDIAVARYFTGESSGTTDVAQPLEFELSPNPGAGFFRIKLNTVNAFPLYITVNDLTGRQVYRSTLTDDEPVDLRFLENGSYFMQAGNGKSRGVRQLIIVTR